MSKRRAGWRATFQGTLVALGLVLLGEGLLRMLGRPAGRYVAGLSEGIAYAGGPWEPGYSGILRSGPVPYRVSVNAHGFRGPELRSGEHAAALRVVAVGDSLTEGFYVDDEATYPAQLEAALQGMGVDAEVINAARGGGSMDRFVAILERCVLPLAPDLILVTFVSNDLADLGWFPLEQAPAGPASRMGTWFVGQTAIGEFLLDTWFGLERAPRKPRALELEDERYRIEGGEQYLLNAGVFLQRYAERDGLSLDSELGPVGQRAYLIYREQLRKFVQAARSVHAKVLFIYMPAYPEIYVQRPASSCRRLLAEEAEELGIGFVDLTGALRRASLDEAQGALHLAPVDFHLNPKGLGVMARELASVLEQSGLLSHRAGE